MCRLSFRQVSGQLRAPQSLCSLQSRTLPAICTRGSPDLVGGENSDPQFPPRLLRVISSTLSFFSSAANWAAAWAADFFLLPSISIFVAAGFASSFAAASFSSTDSPAANLGATLAVGSPSQKFELVEGPEIPLVEERVPSYSCWRHIRRSQGWLLLQTSAPVAAYRNSASQRHSLPLLQNRPPAFSKGWL